LLSTNKHFKTLVNKSLKHYVFVCLIFEIKILTYIYVLGFKLAILLGLAAFVGKNVEYIKIELFYSIYLIF